jgi:hypothetical protein
LNDWRNDHLSGGYRAPERRRFRVAASGLIMSPYSAATLGGAAMAVPLSLGPVHHLRLTVTDVERCTPPFNRLITLIHLRI